MLKQELYNTSFDLPYLAASYDKYLKSLQNKIIKNEPYYKALNPSLWQDSLEKLNKTATDIRQNFSDVIIISMGGAYLNPVKLIKFLPDASSVKFHFLHSTDPYHIKEVLGNVNLKNCAILAISKSGNTLETITILGVVLGQFLSYGITNFTNNSFFITKPESKLGSIASELGAKIIPHEQDISGRYSAFNCTTLLPALIAKIDVEKYLQGAHDFIFQFLKSSHDHPALHSALAIHRLQHHILANITYSRYFSSYLDWQSQIIAESLGKTKSIGFTPIKSIGPDDQHSLYQLYLDGPDDKFYSYYTIDEGIDRSLAICDMEAFKQLKKVELSLINDANMHASLSALVDMGKPVRKITVKRNAYDIGQVTALSMLEVILMGEIMQVNPFDQKGVELIKDKTKHFIAY